MIICALVKYELMHISAPVLKFYRYIYTESWNVHSFPANDNCTTVYQSILPIHNFFWVMHFICFFLTPWLNHIFPLHIPNFMFSPSKVNQIVYWILHNRAFRNGIPTIIGVWVYYYLIGIISLANLVLKQHTQHMHINNTISRHIFSWIVTLSFKK